MSKSNYRCLRAIYYLNNRKNVDHICIQKRILKFINIIDLNIYKYACIKLGIIIKYIHIFNNKKR